MTLDAELLWLKYRSGFIVVNCTAREMVWAKLSAIFEKYDILIYPATAIPAFSLDQFGPTEINGKPINPWIGWFLTYPLNMTGNPAASIPCGFSDDGLPIGLQIVDRWMEDAVVLRTSRAFELAAPWAHTRPALD